MDTGTKVAKTLVVGIDGLPYTLIDSYIGKGYLPNLKRILSEGYSLRQMDASIPDVSSTSWTSFMTGVNPGEHGIYGFMDLRPGTYRMTFPNFTDVQAPPIWDIIGSPGAARQSTLSSRFRHAGRGLKSVILNIPQTFPAPRLNGVLTAGFVCPDFKKGTYPDSAYEYLKSIGYIPDIDATKAVSSPDEFFREAHLALRKREEAFAHFMDEGDWSLFIGVITETDRIHHYFFDASSDEGHSRHADFLAFYKEMDLAVGRLYERFMDSTGGKGLFMTMSDHGFTTINKEVYINSFLRENGYLRLNASREYYEQIDSGTVAFAMDPARIYINLEGKYPLGFVKAGDKDGVEAEIKGRLMALRSPEGEPVVKAVYGAVELYSGPARQRGPDLVCVGADGFDLKGNLKKGEVFGRSQFKGMHTRHDAHVILPAGMADGDRLHIEGLAGMILSRMV